MNKLSIWIHEGPGHYIGSTIVVIAESEMSARLLIRQELILNGLEDEDIKLHRKDIDKEYVILSQNGDY